MDKAWRQALVAVIVGALLPRLLLSAGIWLAGPQIPEGTETAPSQTEVSTVETKPDEPVPVPVYIPVLTGKADISVMELENYVVGVVLAEMPASFESEALKAQAVVARTYALRRISQADRHPDGAVCTDSGCCQAYISEKNYLESQGTERDILKIRQAVSDTAGVVLMYGETVAEATYFSCSGGRTEDALEVWGADIPYLQALDSPGEEDAVNYRASAFFSKDTFGKALGLKLSGSPETWLGRTTYTAGHGVKTMVVGEKSFTGTEIRQLLGLNSTQFTMTAENGGVRVTTQGKGHRVGMSQYGADAMAAGGSDYLQILCYYYPGTGIDKVGEIG